MAQKIKEYDECGQLTEDRLMVLAEINYKILVRSGECKAPRGPSSNGNTRKEKKEGKKKGSNRKNAPSDRNKMKQNNIKEYHWCPKHAMWLCMSPMNATWQVIRRINHKTRETIIGGWQMFYQQSRKKCWLDGTTTMPVVDAEEKNGFSIWMVNREDTIKWVNLVNVFCFYYLCQHVFRLVEHCMHILTTTWKTTKPTKKDKITSIQHKGSCRHYNRSRHRKNAGNKRGLHQYSTTWFVCSRENQAMGCLSNSIPTPTRLRLTATVYFTWDIKPCKIKIQGLNGWYSVKWKETWKFSIEDNDRIQKSYRDSLQGLTISPSVTPSLESTEQASARNILKSNSCTDVIVLGWGKTKQKWS